VDTVARLRAEFEAPGLYLDEPEALRPFAVDWTGKFRGATPLVARPRSTEEVSRLLAACNRAGIAVVPQGGNTGMVGGSVPRGGEVVLSLSRMNRIENYDSATETVQCQAGVVLEALHRELAERGRAFAVDLGARGSCQVGGMIATNAGGIKVLRYGHMREQLRGLEVVLADGSVLSNLNRLRKNNTGLDLKHLFVGSEGILGVITRAVLQTRPLWTARQTALFGLPAPAGLSALAAYLMRSLDGLSSLEFLLRDALDLVLAHQPQARDPFAARHGAYVLAETESAQDRDGEPVLSVLAGALGQGLAADALIAESEGQRADFWRLRETIAEAIGKTGLTHKFDVTVPPGAIPAFIERVAALASRFEGLVPILFGHLGDGNVHVNLMQGKGLAEAPFRALEGRLGEAVYGQVRDLGGSVSAEHGIGVLKRAYLGYSRTTGEIALMRRMKALLDPKGILNPGVMFEP